MLEFIEKTYTNAVINVIGSISTKKQKKYFNYYFVIDNTSVFFFFFNFLERVLTFNLWRSLLMINLYYHTKTSIGFLRKRELNSKSLI